MATTTTTTSTTINNNRIPLSVSHGVGGNNYEYRSTSNNAANGTTNTSTTYDMRNMNEETDKIKLRMREFEERCKKWREDFFNGQTNCQDCDGNQRVPFSGQNTVNIDNGASPNKAAGPFHTSTMHHSHRINIEDTSNGGKKYKIEFEIGDFKQNELQISTHGSSTLVVKGDRELKAGHATETKTFNREITLPEYVDVSKMNAYLLDQHSENNVLIVEAPVIMEKYAYRRSAFDKSQSPVRITSTTAVRAASPPKPTPQNSASILKTSHSTGNNGGLNELASSSSSAVHHHHHHHQSSESKSSTTTSTKVVRGDGPGVVDFNNNAHFRPNDTALNLRASRSNLSSTVAPELIKGYPVYDPVESSVVYKFDLSGFDQSEIQLTITVDRTLEIKATKELQDHLGKIYREFKREIHLENDVDLNAIKNVLHEGILTLKIPKQNRPDGMGSMSNSHNLQSPNGFKEFYNDDGKLIKLSSDFRGYSPENVKIVLSANNVLKVTAQQTEQSPNGKGTVQKECTRHYTLPAWVQPENMKAIMSRDGILNVDIKH